MTEFQTATLALQEAELEIGRSALEISRSATRVGIGQIVAGVLQTLVIAGGLLFMRSVRTAAGARAVVLVRYAGQQWDPVAGTQDDAAAGQVCAAGVTAFGPLAVGYANAVPTFGDATVGALAWQVNAAQVVALPAGTARSATRWSPRRYRRG